jgi:hypothetical protein
MLLIPCGILAGMLHKDVKIRNLTLFSAITAITFFLVISSAQTKLAWYDLPLYPFLSILVGVFIYFVFSFLKEEKRISHYLKYNMTPYIFIFLMFITPYRQIVNRTYKQEEWSGDANFYRTSYYLRDIRREKRQEDNFIILYDNYAAHINFYVNLLNEKGKNISLRKSKEVKTGEVVLTVQEETKKFLEENYECKILETFHNLRLYEIVCEK